MNVSILLAYFVYCKKIRKNPEIKELIEWKLKYNHR